ncbi:MAG: hypothetical protein HKN04_10380 [Rhodothermaceae bacterium]|nr:hypothetical protein [Rhodothermaceae bacterium]
MKKFFAIAACAILLTGCDFVGGSPGETVGIAGVTINAMPAATDLYVEIQDAGGRAIASSDAESFDGSLPYAVPGLSGDVAGTTRAHYLVLMERDSDGTNSLIAVSDPFSGDEIRAAEAGMFPIQSSGIDAELAIAP